MIAFELNIGQICMHGLYSFSCDLLTLYMYWYIGLLKFQEREYEDAAKLFTRTLEVDATHDTARKKLDLVKTLLQQQ